MRSDAPEPAISKRQEASKRIRQEWYPLAAMGIPGAKVAWTENLDQLHEQGVHLLELVCFRCSHSTQMLDAMPPSNPRNANIVTAIKPTPRVSFYFAYYTPYLIAQNDA